MKSQNLCKPSLLLALTLLCLGLPPQGYAAAKVNVVTTLAVYGSIAEAVGGDRVSVQSISRSDEDAHFVKPKPSFALMLKDADLFVSTGLDLELWAPVLVDKSGNTRIRDGQPGYVSASAGAVLLDVPQSTDRSQGDVHIYGNPHIFTSPINAKIIATNIAAGLKRVDRDGAAAYEANLERFKRSLDEAMYGAQLVEILGAETLDSLTTQGKLVSFLERQQYEGKPLVDSLGGWMKRAAAFRDKKIVAYHKNWTYFAHHFGVDIADYVEAKPGIPPSARHVHELVELIAAEKIPVLLAASYYPSQQVRAIAERTGCRAVRVPMGPGSEGITDYLSYIDFLVDHMADAFTT